MGDADLQEAINRAAEAARVFMNGNPDGYTQLWSNAEDVTIFGGFGAAEQGYDAVIGRIVWASARFRSGDLHYEPISSGSSGDLGYAVGIERGQASVVGQDEPGELVLRVTHLFRREHGEWRLLHRHADAVTTVIPPAALLAPATGTDGAR
jgi:ketosteroid isomerase-like protein